MKRITAGILIVMGLGLLTAGCGSEAETKNMEQIYAEEGVPVKAETIVPTMFSSKIEYNAVLTGVRESSAYALVDDKIDKINYRVGDLVEKDAVVLSFPVDNPEANYYQAKVAFENAETSFKRMESYYESGGLSRQDIDNARTSFEVARANWDAVRQSVMVKAPITGVVTRINVRESDNVRKDDELLAVSQIDRLKARIWVSEKHICEFKKGLKASARWNDVVLRGDVVQVDMSMNQERQAFGAVIEFANPNLAVKCGVTVNLTVETYQNPDAIVVERKNLLEDAAGQYVFVATDGLAVQRRVELGRSSELDVEAISGLTSGDVLITEGQLHLKNGDKIRIIESDNLRAFVQ